jgi:pimeloyl-ACP methyl ester carboxylesterase
MSSFSPRWWDAYSTPSLLKLLGVIIDKYLEDGQEIVFVCHSMGCSLGALLTSTTSPVDFKYREKVKGLIAICPPGKPIPNNQVKTLKRLLSVVIDPIFDLWRAWDRRGGTESVSVTRFVGKNAEEQLKRMQVRFNNQSRTPVFRRMAYGCLPIIGPAAAKAILPCGALIGKDIWSGIKTPVLIIAGKDDPVTTADEAILIASYLGHSGSPDDHHSNDLLRDTGTSKITSSVESSPNKKSPSKLVILPSPASHALVYSPLTVRPVSSLLQNFLHTYVTEKLSLGWQLQFLTTEGKWDVKNLEKWRAVNPVSTPIAGVFRAMKTLREVDDEHAPSIFVKNWSKDIGTGVGKDGQGPVVAVVDISHDSPVYNPAGLEEGGIAYRKFPTVSKLPPTRDEVRHFIDLIDHLRSELDLPLPDAAVAEARIGEQQVPKLIAVHCHYGFNRTGFFVIAYLVERLGWPLKEAIEEFELQRPPGVRHTHFQDELWGRYFDWDDQRGSS